MSEVLTPLSEETKSGTNAKGTWTVHKFTFDGGVRASTFDPTVARFLLNNLNKAVNVDIAKKEKGWDVVSAWPLDGQAPPPKQHITVEKKSGDDYMRPRNPGESRTIAKQACLKAAVQFLAAGGRFDPTVSGDIIKDRRAVLDVADSFLEWVFQEEVGVRHIRADHTNADVAAEREAVLNDKPADRATKDLVVGLLGSASADAKAVLHSYGLRTVGDVNARLTEHVARLFIEANSQIPL